MRKLLAALGLGAVLALTLAPEVASATQPETEPHQVLVCKYVGQPGVDETLQTGQNPIVVDTHALEDGFVGVFPFEFSDAQGRSIAIRYLAEDESPGDVFDLDECPAPDVPEDIVCPEGTDNAGQIVPEGETIESFCDDEEVTPSPTPSPEPEPSEEPPVGKPDKPDVDKPNAPNLRKPLPVTGLADTARLVGAVLILGSLGTILIRLGRRTT